MARKPTDKLAPTAVRATARPTAEGAARRTATPVTKPALSTASWPARSPATTPRRSSGENRYRRSVAIALSCRSTEPVADVEHRRRHLRAQRRIEGDPFGDVQLYNPLITS